MKVVFAVLLLLFTGISCRKNAVTYDDLTGNWRLVELIDKATFTSIPRPGGSAGDVVLSFEGNQRFSGNTFNNTIDSGTYTINGANKITFGSFAMTKVGEDQWGSGFLTVLIACGLQSIHPCAPSTYTITGRRLLIESAMRYNILLERM
jgi:META domain